MKALITGYVNIFNRSYVAVRAAVAKCISFISFVLGIEDSIEYKRWFIEEIFQTPHHFFSEKAFCYIYLDHILIIYTDRFSVSCECRPEDTPYSCGCFQFDIFFPSGYPKIPPLVNLQVCALLRFLLGCIHTHNDSFLINNIVPFAALKF